MPAPTPSGLACALAQEGLSSSLVGLSLHSVSLTPEGSSWLLPVLHHFHGLHPSVPGSAPSCPRLRGGACRRGRVRVMLRTAGLLAFLTKTLSAGFDAGVSPGRRRSATRRLDPYRDRTFTGKPNVAYLDTRRRRPAPRRRGQRSERQRLAGKPCPLASFSPQAGAGPSALAAPAPGTRAARRP